MNGEIWLLAILLLVFFGAGIPIFLGALISAQRTLRIVWSGSRAEGVIVEAEQGKAVRTAVERRRAEGRKVVKLTQPYASRPTRYIWTLTIEFEDATGTRRQGTIDSGTRKRPYDVGDRVPIWYVPGEPSAIRINSFAELWGGPLLIGVFGALLLVFGFGMLVRSGFIPLE